MDWGAILSAGGGSISVLSVVGGGLAYWLKYRAGQQRNALRSSFVIIDRLEKQVEAGQRALTLTHQEYVEARVRLAEAYGACERAIDSARRMAAQLRNLGGEPEEVPEPPKKWEPPPPPQEPGFLVRTNRQNVDFSRAIVRDVRDEAMGDRPRRPQEDDRQGPPETYLGGRHDGGDGDDERKEGRR